MQSAFHSVLAKKGITAGPGPTGATQVGGPHPQAEDFNTALDALSNGQPVPATTSAGSPLDACAKLGAELAWAKITGNEARAAQLEGDLKFGACDPLWSEVVAEYVAFTLSKKAIPYRGYGGDLGKFVLPLPAPDAGGLRIAVIADWGTGTGDAVRLLAAVMAKSPHLLIHLGDIYYSGTQDEMNGNFLEVLKNAGVTVPVYSLTGNHDMYSGGAGYYWLIDQLGQPASYFCLRNDDWQLLAMDTGYHDSDPENVDTNITYLEPSEEAWHLDKLAHAGGRKTVLLSHHQLFTFAETCGSLNGVALSVNPRLQATFGPAIASGQVAYWLWGHEHNFIAYQPFLGLGKSACVGAGALPVLIGDMPYNVHPALTNTPPYIPAAVLQNDGTIYNHMFGIITLSGAAGQIDYYQVNAAGQQVPWTFSQTF
jgi:predicted phosphodiesterase